MVDGLPGSKFPTAMKWSENAETTMGIVDLDHTSHGQSKVIYKKVCHAQLDRDNSSSL